MAFLLLALTAACCLRRFVQAYTFTDLGTLKDAVDAWDANPTAAETTYGSIEDWDVSHVNSLDSLFKGMDNFTADLSKWNTTRVTSLSFAFIGAGNFNADLSKWDTGGVTSLSRAFYQAGNFNVDISKWDTARVTSLYEAFYQAGNFNADLSKWDTARVTSLDRAFYQAGNFNADLSKWDTARVTSLDYAFYQAGNFNADLSNWDTGGVTSLAYAFYEDGNFNADLSKWDTAGVTNMLSAFYYAESFNADLSKWDTARVTYLTFMFAEAGNFNADLSKWNTTRVTNMYQVFDSTGLSSCKKDLIADSWGRKNDIAAFKVAYPEWEAWITFECATCAAGFWCNKSATDTADIKQECDAGGWCPENTTSAEDQKKCPNGSHGRKIPAENTGGFKTQSEACELCRPGFSGAGEGKVDFKQGCQRCTDGTWSSFGAPECFLECVELGTYCELGRGSDDGNCTCTPCPVGTALSTLGSTSVAACLPCEGAFVAPSSGTANCKACEPGTHSNGDHTECEECLAGKAREFDQTTCTDCSAGEYTDEAGSAACTRCLPGTKANKPDGNATDCELCESGEFQDQAGQIDCKPCSAGEYTDEAGSATCTRCLPGTKANKPDGGATDCELCESGEFQDQAGQTDCKPCDPVAGSIDDEGSLACNPCLPGSIVNANGSCELCPAGTISDGGRATDCTECKTGSSERGAAYCEDCKAGTFLNRSKSPPTCDGCPVGEVSKAGSSTCTKCVAGTWQNGTDCVACPAGYFGNQTGLFNETCNGACPPGTHSYRYATKCLDCEVGKHAPNANMEDCVACDDRLKLTPSKDATTCLCEKGTYLDANGVCVECSDEVECGSIGKNLALLAMRPDNWRPSATSEEFLACPFDSACLGGVNASCAEGNQGVLCAICSESYYRPIATGACKQCWGVAEAWVLFVFGLVFTSAMIVLLIYMNRTVSNGVMRPFISMLQNLSIIMLFNAPYPEVLKSVFSFVGSISLGFEFASPRCTGLDFSFYTSLFAFAGIFFLVVLGVLILPVLHKVRNGATWSATWQTDVGQRAVKDIFILVLLVHPGLSGKAMQYFRCREVGGVSYLMSDYSIECYDERWWSFLFLDLVILLGFGLGTPIAIVVVLYSKRRELFDSATLRPYPTPLSVLYHPYRPGAWYFEAVSMTYKVVSWGTLVYFAGGSVGQFLVVSLVNVAMLSVMIGVMPMGKIDAKFLNGAQIAVHAMLMMLALGGLAMVALEVEVVRARLDDDQGGEPESLISVIQSALAVITFGLTSLVTLYIAQRMYRKVSNTTLITRVTRILTSLSGRQQDPAADDHMSVEMVENTESRVSFHVNPVVEAASDPGSKGLACPPPTSQ